MATLLVAVFDGLFLELMSTGDRRRTGEALDEFIRLVRRARSGGGGRDAVEIPAIAPLVLWRTSALGVLLALGFFSLPVGTWVHEDAGLANRLVYELIVWAWVAGILLYVEWVERRRLSSIGFRALGGKDWSIAILAGVLILALLALISLVVFPALHWSESSQEASILALPYWLNVLIVVRAAVSEEILFRGYPMERLRAKRHRALAGVVTCAIFTDHISFWGWHHIFIAGSAGAALTVLYLWRRNIWVNTIASGTRPLSWREARRAAVRPNAARRSLDCGYNARQYRRGRRKTATICLTTSWHPCRARRALGMRASPAGW